MKIFFSNVGLMRFSIKKCLEYALKTLGQPSDKLEVNVSVVSEDEIKSLNNEFRQVDSVTDVLSFPAVEVGRKVIDVNEFDVDSINPETNLLSLGDIIICKKRATEQAKEYGHSLKREMCFLAVHSLLHLLGYDHMEKADEEEMIALQKQIMNGVGIVK